MKNNKTFLAIIPARGGSKRLPHKNILELCDKPLIQWTIESGKKSKYIDKVIVTSDDSKILDISRKNGAKILKRPDELASDTATTFDAINHVIQTLIEKFDFIVLLQPTSPLRNSNHIDEAIELLEEKKADAVVSVCEVEHSPLWSNNLPSDGSLEGFLRKDVISKRSQDLETYFQINGAIYICETSRLLEEKTFFLNDNIFSYIMKRKDSIDIDEKLDFKLAEFILKENND